jgi:hypothetical protein
MTITWGRQLGAWLGTLTILLTFLPPAAPAQEPRPDDQAQSSGEVAVKCQWFGVGGSVRPGEWAGIQLTVTDSSDKPREVIVRIPMPDADGDKAAWEATLTTNPGVNQPVWAYLRLPSRFRANEPVKFAVFAAVESASANPGDATSLTAGRQLASGFILPRQVVSSGEGMLGIVGSRIMGLGHYAGTPGLNSLPMGHERWEIIQRLDSDALPDRWMGLMQFAALVWNDPQPSALNTEKSQAIREWVLRGGHLVVVLPTVAQTWNDEANNPLFDITPRVRVNRKESQSLEPLRALITRKPRLGDKPEDHLEMPTNEVIQTLTPLDGATPAEAECIIGMPAPFPDNEWLVARRQVGLGMVTFVGLNAATRFLEQRGLPDPELFWHRILGRRGQMTAVKESSDMSPGINIARTLVTLDNSIADQIAKTTLAGAGVLMGLAIFIIYWLIAGPVGYAALKKTGNQRHSWLAFVLAAALFTGIAWGGATAIRPARVSAAHLTILDHVYTPQGESVQRARAWMSVLIPEYGEASVAVGDPTKSGSAKFHNLITPWEPETASTAGFPDARTYRINSRAPDHFSIPTRSTVKQFQVDWAGGPVWDMPRPVSDAKGEPVPITAALNEKGALVLSGSLMHKLPDALRDAVIIVNLGQNPLIVSWAGAGAWKMTSKVFAAEFDGPWEPGQVLDLSHPLKYSLGDGPRNVPGKPSNGYFGALLENLAGSAPDQMDGSMRDSSSLTALIKKMKALTFFGEIEPPNLEDESSRGFNVIGKPRIIRRYTHGLDLSPWFTQPCIIIVGYVGKDNDTVPSPVPLMVGSGRSYSPVPTTGRTIVRWVYPLPTKPPAYKSEIQDEKTAPSSDGPA